MGVKMCYINVEKSKKGTGIIMEKQNILRLMV